LTYVGAHLEKPRYFVITNYILNIITMIFHTSENVHYVSHYHHLYII